MKNQPFVSIIINNYNYGCYLKEAIESCLAQDYPYVETIVVDDGSIDNSHEIISAYTEQIRPVFKKNGGQASAMNAGFSLSRGEFIIFLDSDDILYPETVSMVVQAFERRPKPAKIQYRMEVIDASGRRSGVFKPALHLPLLCGDLTRHILWFPDDLPWLPTSGNAFPREVLDEIFPIPEEDFQILADFYLSHLTPLFGTVVTLSSIGAYYRVHGANRHELGVKELNLPNIRQTIIHWRKTHAYLKILAIQRGLIQGSGAKEHQVLSVTYVAHRLISLKFDPGQHPFSEDAVSSLFVQGCRAALRRFDVSLPMRLAFMTWFFSMAILPPRQARCLALWFLFPEQRKWLNSLLNFFRRYKERHASVGI